MIQKMSKDNSGFTLVEVLTVMVIIAVMVSVSLPVFAGTVRHTKQNSYVDEAKRVAETAQAMIMEEYAAGIFDDFEFAAVAYTVMDPRTNPVAARMEEGSYTPKARIQEVGLNENTMKFTYLEYHVATYKIVLDFKNGEVRYK